jgi:hypothetical protein
MNSSTFWNITPCSLLKIDLRLGEAYSLNFQGRKINRTRNRHEAGSKLDSCLVYFSILKREATGFSKTSVDL